MPAKSAAQFGFMASRMNDPSILGSSSGVTRSVAKEFVEKTPAKKRKKFAQILAKKRMK